MADILPLNQTLPEIIEDSNESFTFQYTLDSGEVLKSFKISSNNFPESITVDEATFYGKFTDIFELPLNSMKYRKGLEYGTASKFSELPPKGMADLYSIVMPGEMLKYFNISVELEYEEASSTTVQKMIKQYRQPVRGNRYRFISQFLNYVR